MQFEKLSATLIREVKRTLEREATFDKVLRTTFRHLDRYLKDEAERRAELDAILRKYRRSSTSSTGSAA